jgi:hypothetical protein
MMPFSQFHRCPQILAASASKRVVFDTKKSNSAYAEFEREVIRDRVKAGIKAKREKAGT